MVRILAAAASLLAAACGGGSPAAGTAPAIAQFTADRAAYHVGDRARLTAVFSGGSGRIEPHVGAVSSGETIETPVLDRRVSYRLVVESAGRTATRALDLAVSYRDRYVDVATLAVTEHAAVATGDGAVLVIGGSRGHNTLSDAIDRFDPSTRSFIRVGTLRTGRSGHTATRLADGRILVAGGATSLSIGNVADVIDERTGAVTGGGTLADPRGWHATTLLADGRVLVTGGINRDTAEFWDPATNTWRRVAARMAGVRVHHTATLLADGRVLVAGGGPGGAQFAEIFDPATERFEPVAAAPAETRQLHAAHRLSDGSVLLIGGEAPDGNGGIALLASVLRFDPGAGRIDSVTPLAAPRSLVRSMLQPDDGVLMFGGEEAFDAPTASGEAYGRGAGGRPLAPMVAARRWHTVTRLPDGRVLIVGGDGPDGTLVPQVVIYE